MLGQEDTQLTGCTACLSGDADLLGAEETGVGAGRAPRPAPVLRAVTLLLSVASSLDPSASGALKGCGWNLRGTGRCSGRARRSVEAHDVLSHFHSEMK